MAKIKITQTKSTIGKSVKQKRTLLALGLRKINQSVVKEESEMIAGMVNVVSHLVTVEQA